MKTNLRVHARAYQRLLDEARALNVPTSLDDPRSPRTVAALERAALAHRPSGGRREA